MDTAWSQLTTYWERVRWARAQWAQRTGNEDKARAAAAALRMQENTYTTWERPPRSEKGELPLGHARDFGKLFRVSWVWLATGEGTPFDADPGRNDKPAADKVRAALDGILPPDEVEQIAGLTELLDRKRAAG